MNETVVVWKKLEEYKVVNRQKDIVWMACQNVLPIKEFQKKRDLVRSEVCLREGCGSSESVMHVFWNCEFAYGIWKRMGCMCKELAGVTFINWKAALFRMGACNRRSERILWFIMCYFMESLWDVRNLWVFERQGLTEVNCVRMILSTLAVYYKRDSQGGGGTEAEGVWKYLKWRN